VIRAAIVDDEPLARRGICQLLEGHDDIAIVAECANGTDALEAVRSGEVDLLFLDVQMPEMDGFDVVRQIGSDRMPAVVFITAYDEFAVRAFEASAVDYLMKPVGPERFASALSRVRERRGASAALSRVSQLQALLDRVARPSSPLNVPTARGVIRIEPREIDWIGADDYYAVLHIGEKHFLLRESLASLEERLPGGMFVRVHRSAIVNCAVVREVRQSVLILRNGTKVEMSRRRRAAVSAALRGAVPG
jgi:two-component system LytT family response regulator